MRNMSNMTINTVRATSAIALVALAACGTISPTSGGGTAPTTSTGTPPPSGTPYQTFNSTAAVTSTLGGRAAQINTATGAIAVANVTGSITHNTKAVTVNDTKYTLTDPDGPSTTGLLSDGTVSAQLDPFPSTYSYVTIYTNQDYTVGATSYNANGVAGIITKSTDVPTTGTASYSGTARGIHLVGATETNLSGNSSVSADFGAGKVNVTMNGFSATNASGGPVTTPITEITVTGASIVGNAFDGGTVAAKNGSTAIVPGGTPSQFSGGNFFGYNGTTLKPAEVGGVAGEQGSNITYGALYIAK